jgi:hypothetical protein
MQFQTIGCFFHNFSHCCLVLSCLLLSCVFSCTVLSCLVFLSCILCPFLLCLPCLSGGTFAPFFITVERILPFPRIFPLPFPPSSLSAHTPSFSLSLSHFHLRPQLNKNLPFPVSSLSISLTFALEVCVVESELVV